jgi:hypothetical protein
MPVGGGFNAVGTRRCAQLRHGATYSIDTAGLIDLWANFVFFFFIVSCLLCMCRNKGASLSWVTQGIGEGDVNSHLRTQEFFFFHFDFFFCVVFLYGRLQYVTSRFIRELPMLSACVDINLRVRETKIFFFQFFYILDLLCYRCRIGAAFPASPYLCRLRQLGWM